MPYFGNATISKCNEQLEMIKKKGCSLFQRYCEGLAINRLAQIQNISVKNCCKNNNNFGSNDNRLVSDILRLVKLIDSCPKLLFSNYSFDMIRKKFVLFESVISELNKK